MLQHVAHNERQVFLRHYLLLIAQLGDSLRYAACLLGRELQTQLLQVLGYVGLAAVLAQRVLTSAPESLRHQGVAVQIILLVAIGMHASHLGKHVVADNRLIRRHHDAAVAFNQSRYVVQLILADVGAGVELVFQNHLHTR